MQERAGEEAPPLSRTGPLGHERAHAREQRRQVHAAPGRLQRENKQDHGDQRDRGARPSPARVHPEALEVSCLLARKHAVELQAPSLSVGLARTPAAPFKSARPRCRQGPSQATFAPARLAALPSRQPLARVVQPEPRASSIGRVRPKPLAQHRAAAQHQHVTRRKIPLANALEVPRSSLGLIRFVLQQRHTPPGRAQPDQARRYQLDARAELPIAQQALRRDVQQRRRHVRRSGGERGKPIGRVGHVPLSVIGAASRQKFRAAPI